MWPCVCASRIGHLSERVAAARRTVPGLSRQLASPLAANRAAGALPRPQVRRPRVQLEELGGAVIQSIVDLLNHEEAALGWGR